jgi:CubicO group peptidase (beta-lactamase class C family)
VVLAGALTAPSHGTAAGYAGPALAKKTCTTKKVHGKKKKVCHPARPKPSPTPLPTPVTKLTTGDQVDAYLTQTKFRGYIYLERHGQVILSKGYGMADSQTTVPNTAQTKWPAFNESRFLVALAIMKLQDEGKLSVQDKICAHINACPAAWQPITIHELLTNSSGIGGIDPFDLGVTVNKTMATCQASPLLSAPGVFSTWSECNPFLLSTIIQKVTGKSWAEAMQELVFGPAGMTNTGQMTNALRPPQVGRFYRAGQATPELNYDGTYFAYTSVEDMMRLNHALLAGTLISKQALAATFTGYIHDNPSDSNSASLGYELIMFPTPSTQNEVVVLAEVNGNSEDNAGLEAGLNMSVDLSPDDGAMEIFVANDAVTYGADAEDHFNDLISRLMWGKE